MGTIIWIVVAIFLGLVFSFLIARGFSMRLYDASDILKRVMADNLGKDVSSQERSAMNAASEINAASTKMADAVGAIEEIAFTKNLLSVNASVEAARARDVADWSGQTSRSTSE